MSSAIIISELLPNPAGSDTAGEWIELHNTSDGVQSLVGWSLKDASGKTYAFTTESVPARGFLVLPYRTTKISLNNSGDTIFLYDGSGALVDSFAYAQTMKDDVALARTASGSIAATTQPTPGKENIIVVAAPKQKASLSASSSSGGILSESVASSSGDDNAPITQMVIDDGTSVFSVVGLAALVGIICAGVIVFLYRKLFEENGAF